MPTKAKSQNKQNGFFEEFGKKIDSGITWIKSAINYIRDAYYSLNNGYNEKIHRGRILKILPPSLIVLVLFIVMLSVFTVQIVNNHKILLDNKNNGLITPTEPLYAGEVTQKLPSEYNISSIDILVGTHGRLNHAEYIFSLEKDRETIYSETFSAESLSDNKYHRFEFPTLQLEEEGEYIFSIKALNVDSDNAISVYRNTETGEIIYKLSQISPYRHYIFIISSVFLLVFFIINLLTNFGKIKTEFHFFTYALIYIISLVFIYPACTIPDEQYHFLGAVRLAEYDLSDSLSQNLSRTEVNLPSNSECLMTQYLYNAGRLNENKYIECFASAPSEDNKYISADNTNRVLAYLPAALGVKLGDLISDSPMVIFYFGRIFNFVAVCMVVVYTTTLIKKHRMLLLAIVMIPMFLQQSVSYSYDGLLNAFCLLIVAYSIRLLTMNVKLRARDVAIMAIALAFIGLIKLPYIVVAVPLIFVKTEKFGRFKWAKWLILSGLLIASVCLYIFDSQIKLPDIDSETTRGRGLPLSALLASPKASIKLFLNTFRVLGGFYITSMLGNFGWFYFSLDPILITSYLVFLVIVTLSVYDIKLSKIMRCTMVLSSLAIIGSIFLAMYLSHTAPGSLIIEGVQGRYFIPVLPLLMLAFTPRKQLINLRAPTCYTFMNLILFCFVVTLLIGFY